METGQYHHLLRIHCSAARLGHNGKTETGGIDVGQGEGGGSVGNLGVSLQTQPSWGWGEEQCRISPQADGMWV